MKRAMTTLVITLGMLSMASGIGARTVEGIDTRSLNSDGDIISTGSIYVIHGIPGLPSDVDVYANGNYVDSFGFNESLGPLSLPAGSYFLEVKLGGTTVLSSVADVKIGGNYTAIAHLDARGGIRLSLFENEMPEPSRTLLTLRHTAQAPEVDVLLERDDAELLFFPDFANSDQIGAAGFRPGTFAAGLWYEGTEVFNSGSLDLMAGTSYMVYAIGTFPDTFQLYVQTLTN